MVALETTVARRSRPYLAALLGLLGLTAVVLVSAALRLRLYQDAYGWTELRLYVLTTIVALGRRARGHDRRSRSLGRMHWLGHGLAVIGVVALVGLNVVAPAAFVAARNVERIIDPSLVPPTGTRGLDADLPRRPPRRCRAGARRGPPGAPRRPNDERSTASSPERQAELARTRPSPARPPGTSGANARGQALATLP